MMDEQHKKEMHKRLELQAKELKFDPKRGYLNNQTKDVTYKEWLKEVVWGEGDLVQQYFEENNLDQEGNDMSNFRDDQHFMIEELENDRVKTIQKDLKVSSADDETDGEGELTVEVETQTKTFYVQTVDGEYRSSLGCWITADGDEGDIDFDDYPDIDFDIIIKAAEEFAESLLDYDYLIDNPNYYNKDTSPYQKRFENK